MNHVPVSFREEFNFKSKHPLGEVQANIVGDISVYAAAADVPVNNSPVNTLIDTITKNLKRNSWQKRINDFFPEGSTISNTTTTTATNSGTSSNDICKTQLLDQAGPSYRVPALDKAQPLVCSTSIC